MAEQATRGGQIALRHQAAYLGAADALAVDQDRRHHCHGETIRARPPRSSVVTVPERRVPVAEVRADQDVTRAQRAFQNVGDEGFAGTGRQRPGRTGRPRRLRSRRRSRSISATRCGSEAM